MRKLRENPFQPYIIVLSVFFVFTVFAFISQTPHEISSGFVAILFTRGVLITDYIAIVGIGGALMNAVVIGLITVVFLVKHRVVPCGKTIMAIYLTAGFSMFGKNLLTMIPITFGIWLYSKAVKEPFAHYYITALLAATISPITSEIIFLNIYSMPVNVLLGVLMGTLAGFMFPLISEFIVNVHKGYNLYNMGFIGGLLATFFSAILASVGIDIETAYYVSGGNNLFLGVMMYVTALVLIVSGVVLNTKKGILRELLAAAKCSGQIPSDYYARHGAVIYINMGLLCALGTSLVLILGAELNGPTLAGILALTGFGAFGKHLRNTIPLITGAIIASYVNKWAPVYPSNIIAILFCTALSPIAGKYGIVWGVITGFVHVSVVHYVGFLSSGLNLYSNGFAAGIVAIVMLPLIEGIRRLFSETKIFKFIARLNISARIGSGTHGE